MVQGKLEHAPPVPVTLVRVMPVPVSLVRMLALLTLCPEPSELEFKAALAGVVPVSLLATGGF